MKQATIPVYIRFGEIPKDKESHVHFSDQVIRNEGGLSVWRAVEANGQYFPILHEDANECAVADYFKLLFSNKPIYLVTGTELMIEGACREPLLMPDTVVVIKNLNYDYMRNYEHLKDNHKSLIDADVLKTDIENINSWSIRFVPTEDKDERPQIVSNVKKYIIDIIDKYCGKENKNDSKN